MLADTCASVIVLRAGAAAKLALIRNIGNLRSPSGILLFFKPSATERDVRLVHSVSALNLLLDLCHRIGSAPGDGWECLILLQQMSATLGTLHCYSVAPELFGNGEPDR